MNKLPLKISVLHIIIKSSYDGAAVYPIRLCGALEAYHHSIISCFKGNAYEEILANGIKCENLVNSGNISYKYLFLKYWRLIKYLRKNSFDIIHYHQGGVGVLLLSFIFRKNAKVIHHLHSGNLIGDNTKQSISMLHLIILKYLATRTHQVAVAKHVFDEYSRNIKEIRNLKLIRNSQPFTFKEKEIRTNSIGFIGRFTKEKGFDIAVEHIQQWTEVNPNFKIFFMGEESKIYLNRFTKELSNSIFLPQSFNTQNFYKSVDLVLFLSTAPEGTPLVVLEALSFDVGVIAFPIKGVIEILGNDYPLYIKRSEDVIDKLKLYYSDKINLDDLSHIHERISKENDYNVMLVAIDKLYSQCLVT
jgi:glycosyltransferase involved in cell wall biosynthesis